jgi:hypothetical protein
MLIAAAITMQVYLSAQILESKYEIAALQAELDAVERVNADIAWQIAMMSRLESIAARARALGFGPVTEETYVTRSAVKPLTAVANTTTVDTNAIDTTAPPQPFWTDIPVETAGRNQTTPASADSISTIGANVEAGIDRMLDQSANRWSSALTNARNWLQGE